MSTIDFFRDIGGNHHPNKLFVLVMLQNYFMVFHHRVVVFQVGLVVVMYS